MFAYNFFIRNYFAGTKNNTYLCKQKVGCGFTAHEDNSTRLAYRKICWRVIFFIYTMANKKSRSIQEQIDLLKNRGMIIEDEEFAIVYIKKCSPADLTVCQASTVIFVCGKTATNFLFAKVSIIFCSGKIICG